MGNCGSSEAAPAKKRTQPIGATGTHVDGFYSAVARDDVAVVSASLTKTPQLGKSRHGDKKETAAHVAVVSAGLDMLKALHKAGALMDAFDNSHNTPLLLAADLGKTDMVNYLVSDCKADVLARGAKNNTALHLATAAGHRDTVKALLSLGAPVNSVNEAKETALHNAAGRGLSEIALLLADGGTDVELRDKQGITAIDLAYANDEEATSNVLRPFYGEGA